MYAVSSCSPRAKVSNGLAIRYRVDNADSAREKRTSAYYARIMHRQKPKQFGECLCTPTRLYHTSLALRRYLRQCAI